MTFSIDWDQRYQENTHMSVWPWTDMVSNVMRFSKPTGPNFKVLELGCGAGANIPFFKSFDFVEYFSIEGSETIVKTLHEKFPELKNNIVVGDFTREIPFDCSFDLVVDRAGFVCSSTKGMKDCLNLVYKKLINNGKFIGIDMYSTMNSEFSKGETAEDKFTKQNFKEGTFANTGKVHFSDKPHIYELFSKFNILYLEHKIYQREIPNDDYTFATWNIVAEK